MENRLPYISSAMTRAAGEQKNAPERTKNQSFSRQRSLCRPNQQFGARAWHCLGNGCLLEKWPGFLTKRGPQSGQGRGQGNGRG